jgi:hypothetical protein
MSEVYGVFVPNTTAKVAMTLPAIAGLAAGVGALYYVYKDTQKRGWKAWVPIYNLLSREGQYAALLGVGATLLSPMIQNIVITTISKSFVTTAEVAW